MTPPPDVAGARTHATALGGAACQSHVPGGPGVRAWLGAGTLGLILGLFVVSLAERELRWALAPIAAFAAVVVLVMARNRERLLQACFILGLQLDVYYRYGYGKARTDGIALPFCIVAGMLLWLQMRHAAAHDDHPSLFYWGELKLPILVLLVTTAVSVPLSGERFAGLGRFVFECQLVLVYVLGLNMTFRNGGVDRIVALLSVALGMQCIIYLLQSYLGFTFSVVGDVYQQGEFVRPGGTVSSNPAGFTSFIFPAVMILAARFTARGEGGLRRHVDLVLLFLGVVAIGLSYTRAAWGALVIGVAWIAVVGAYRGYITQRKLGLVAAGVVVAGIGFAPVMAARMAEAPLGDSYKERAKLNRMAVEVIAANPVLGVGAGGYEHRFKGYISGELKRDDVWRSAVHNEYLLRAAETGLPGGLAWIALMLMAFGQARRLSRVDDAGLRVFGLGWTAGLLALAFQMYWVPWRGFSYNAMLWLMLGVADGALALSAKRKELSAVHDARRDPCPIARAGEAWHPVVGASRPGGSSRFGIEP